MDHWVHDENLFISRKLGSPEGVVQVYKCWSLDVPIAEDSLSLLGETSSPSEIAPATVWGQRDYLRLLEFLEVNSAMVNVHGHVILRSLAKSRRVGRADGPETYWRCLDVLPMHVFGLVRPDDTHGSPQFLITGGDVSLTSPGKVIVDVEDWKGKYEKLDTEFRKLKLEVSTLKDILAGVREDLTASQTENKKLVKENKDKKSGKKELDSHIRDLDGKRQKAIEEAEKLKIEVSKLKIELSESVSKSVLEKEKDTWATFAALQSLDGYGVLNADNVFVRVNELDYYWFGNTLNLSNCRCISSIRFYGDWSVYRNDNVITIVCDRQELANTEKLRWNKLRVFWENKNKTGRLWFGVKMDTTYYTFF